MTDGRTATREPVEAVARAFEERATRRDGEREFPLGPKARRTRESILAAAAVTFVANGYPRTSVADVASAAGVSLGTVYQYFRDRSDLVAALVQQAMLHMLNRTDAVWRPAEGAEALHRIILNFVDGYATAGPIVRVWEEVTHLEPELAELRRVLGRLFTGSVEASLREAAAAGLVDPDVDPAIAAVALAGMVDRYCYTTYVFDPSDDAPEPAVAAAALTRLWINSVGLRPQPVRPTVANAPSWTGAVGSEPLR